MLILDPFEDHCWQDVVDDELLEIYRSYHRPLHVGPRPAVLLVDLYELAYQGGARPVRDVIREHPSSAGIHAHRAIEPTQRLLAMARERQFPVFYSTSAPDPAGATLRQDSSYRAEWYDIRKELTPRHGDRVILKERASCFFGTPLITHLTRLQVDTLVICGQSTSGCVRATAVDAYSYGLHAVVVEDCTFDRSELSHKVSLFDLHHKYADVFTVAQLEKALPAL
ncbi:MAG: isochorismatase hydrolase [Nocardioides sp.]|jgi:maleamate amidohydrolase|uniref:isochorismatase family protein n=1 Tax=Nocardioides sp. TaxID=35761 RepID=UPI00261C1622|nr:isochorismatase family protein [Nocardioides sp.]MCW2835041.1 isochorismatase hydrolase [Nocardioides sp.]